jgi:phage shock protein E
MELFKKIFGTHKTVDLKQIHANNALIIDVRTAQEFNSGHITGAINVPLQSISKEIQFIKKHNRPVITCCLSGGRSAAAKNILAQAGVEVYDGGGWSALQAKIK